jgi:hypothetical protein
MSTVLETETPAPPLLETVFGPELTLKDRCMTRDCSAAGAAQVVVGRGDPLVFCGHHFNDNRMIFEVNGYSIRMKDCDGHDAYMCACDNKGAAKQRDGGSV